MKIAAIDLLPVSIPYRHAELSSRVSRGGVSDVVVRITADDGRIGWGECCSGADTLSVLAAAQAMTPFLIGRSPDEGQIKWTKEQDDFVCWLRNFQRRDWALCVPYEKGGEKGFFPDFLIVRKMRKGFVVDILEPHDDSRLDAWAKVKGLAKFADTSRFPLAG